MTIEKTCLCPEVHVKRFTNKVDQNIAVRAWPKNELVLLDTEASEEHYEMFGETDDYFIYLRPEEAKQLAQMLLEAVEELND